MQIATVPAEDDYIVFAGTRCAPHSGHPQRWSDPPMPDRDGARVLLTRRYRTDASGNRGHAMHDGERGHTRPELTEKRLPVPRQRGLEHEEPALQAREVRGHPGCPANPVRRASRVAIRDIAPRSSDR